MKNKNIDRRHFLKVFGTSTIATSAILTACKKKNDNKDLTKATPTQEHPDGTRTNRAKHSTGDMRTTLV